MIFLNFLVWTAINKSVFTSQVLLIGQNVHLHSYQGYIKEETNINKYHEISKESMIYLEGGKYQEISHTRNTKQGFNYVNLPSRKYQEISRNTKQGFNYVNLPWYQEISTKYQEMSLKIYQENVTLNI